MDKRKLFIVADSAVSTGFAQVTHNLIHHLKDRWEIDVLATNYYGDPHEILKEARHWNPQAVQYGDFYGIGRIVELSQHIKPDIVLFINDPWVLSEFSPLLSETYGKKVGYTPVDAKNIKPMFGERLNAFDFIIPYTKFAQRELSYAGVTVPMSDIPHGVDTQLFRPLYKKEVRNVTGIPEDWYIVQMVDRNSIRKRIDLGLYYFAEWVRTRDIPKNVYFYYHGALKDEGYDLGQLGKYIDAEYIREYGKTPHIHDRIIFTSHYIHPREGIPLDKLVYLYNLADVKLSTSMGEGWGLTTAESMACGIPNIIPRHSALQEWANGGVEYIDINNIPYITPKGINTIGGVPEMKCTIEALDKLYRDETYRLHMGKKGYDLITQDKYRWSSIANQFHAIFEGLLNESTVR